MDSIRKNLIEQLRDDLDHISSNPAYKGFGIKKMAMVKATYEEIIDRLVRTPGRIAPLYILVEFEERTADYMVYDEKSRRFFEIPNLVVNNIIDSLLST